MIIAEIDMQIVRSLCALFLTSFTIIDGANKNQIWRLSCLYLYDFAVGDVVSIDIEMILRVLCVISLPFWQRECIETSNASQIRSFNEVISMRLLKSKMRSCTLCY